MQAMAKMVEQLPVRHPTMSAHAGNGTDSDEFGGSADVATVVKVAGTPPATETSDPYAREVAIGATETSQIKNSTVVDDRQSFTANYPSSKKAMFPEYECELGGNGVRKPPFNDDDDLAARRELMDTGNWRPTLFGTNDVRMRSPHQSLKPAGRHEVDAESDRDYDGELDMDVESGLARHVVVSTSKIPIVPDSFKRLQTRKNAQVQERIVGDALFTAESEDMHSEDGSSSSADDDEDRRQQSGYSSGNDDSYECQLDLRIAGHQRQHQYNDVTIDEETSASLKRSIKPPKSCFSIVNILRPEFGAIPAGSKSPSPPPNASVPSHKAKTAPAHASALRRAHQQAMTAASRKLQPKTTPMPRSSPPEIASSNASNDGGIEMRNQLLLQSKQMMQQFQQQQEIMYHLQNQQQQQQPIMIQGTPFSAAVNGAASTAILDQRQLPVGFNPYATFYAAAAIAAAMAVATGASPANTAPGVQALAGANAMAPRQIVPLPVHHTAQLPEQIKTGNAFCVGNDIDNNNVMAAVVKKFDCCSSGTAGGHPRGEKTRSDVISDDELVCYSNESAKMATISPRYKTSATIEQSHRKFRPSAKVSTATSITSGGPPHQTDKKRSANVTSSDARKTTTTSGPESNHRSTPTAAAGDKANLPPLPWPAWVYCTRYSDRPSSGPRSRKPKKKDTGAHGSVHGDEKRPRTAFTAGQLERLKREFDDSKYLTEERRQSLARELSLNESQIKIWFQNKRAKMKKASGVRNQLALQLMAQGLYNHSSGSGSSQSSTSSKSSGQLPGGQKQPNSGLSPNVVQRTAEWAILAN